jgi:hypothetical protein
MAFEFHDSVRDHPVFGKLSIAAFGVWSLAGTWTSANHTNGFVSDAAAARIAGPDNGTALAELVTSGAWSRVDGGYKMEYGPSADFPLPMWRYGTPVSGGRLFEIVRDPDEQPRG